jgi:hypothetical protein
MIEPGIRLRTYGGHAAGDVPRLARVIRATPRAIIKSDITNRIVLEIRLFFFMVQNYSFLKY